jgi:hypothetical protein
VKGEIGEDWADVVYSFRSERYFGKGRELARTRRLVPAVE